MTIIRGMVLEEAWPGKFRFKESINAFQVTLVRSQYSELSLLDQITLNKTAYDSGWH